MRARNTTIATCLLLAAVTTGCSSSSKEEPTVGKVSKVDSASPTPSPTTPSPSQETFEFGNTADSAAGGRKWSATVLAFKDQGITGDPGLGSDGQKWALAEVKVCNRGTGAFPVTPFTWSLAYADGVRVEPTHVSSGLPEPLYPMETKVKGGDCARGDITFEVPLEGRAERVVYSPSDLDEPVDWTVPKA